MKPFSVRIKVLSFIAVFLLTVLYYSLPKERFNKLTAEISRIKERTYTNENCVQYALIADVADFYPCFNCDDSLIFLHRGEVWKYGKTCQNANKRYEYLALMRVKILIQFTGTEKLCLIEEKKKIYNYSFHTENIRRSNFNGSPLMLRPPGNKIDN